MPSITITYPAGDGQRFAAALGKVLQLKDAQDPPQPRSATAAECKAWLIGRAVQLINDVEGPVLAAANPPPQPPTVDMT